MCSSAKSETAENQILRMAPPVRRIDCKRTETDPIAEHAAKRPVRDPWPLQAEAIGNVVAGLGVHDRGQLVMACGAGKTFSALRIAERRVPTGGRVLFLAPSIALVSQARRERLLHTRKGIGTDQVILRVTPSPLLIHDHTQRDDVDVGIPAAVSLT